MGGFKASIEPISGFKPANNQDYPLYNWHHVFTGNPNDQNDDTRLDDTIREINETLDGAVLYSEAQTLTEAQKQQARDNIGASTGAVLYSQAQSLTEAQKQQARENIGTVQLDDTLTQTGKAADAKKTGDEISGLKDDLKNTTKLEHITLAKNKYIRTDTNPIVLTMSDTPGFNCALIPCAEGDVFSVTGSDGSVAHVAVFTDSHGEIIDNITFNATFKEDLLVVAPKNTSYLVYNASMDRKSSCIKNSKIIKSVVLDESDFETGAILPNTGDTSTGNRLRSKTYIADNILLLNSSNSDRFCVYAYNLDDSYYGLWNGSTFVKPGAPYWTSVCNISYILLKADSTDKKLKIVFENPRMPSDLKVYANVGTFYDAYMEMNEKDKTINERIEQLEGGQGQIENIEAKINDLNEETEKDIKNISGYEKITYTNGCGIKTNTNPISDFTPNPEYEDYCCALIPCKEGDSFLITGRDAGVLHLAVFTDVDGNILEDITGSANTKENVFIVAPRNSTWLVCNAHKNYAHKIIKNYPIAIKNDLNNNEFELGGLNPTSGEPLNNITTRLRSKNYINENVCFIDSVQNERFGLFAYNQDNSFYGMWTGHTFVNNSGNVIWNTKIQLDAILNNLSIQGKKFKLVFENPSLGTEFRMYLRIGTLLDAYNRCEKTTNDIALSVENKYTNTQNNIKTITENAVLDDWIMDHYFSFLVDPVNLNPTETSLKYNCMKIPCTQGDVFTISGGSYGAAANLWGFVTLGGQVLSKAVINDTAYNQIIIAPPNTAYLLVNWVEKISDADNIVTVISGIAISKKFDDLYNSSFAGYISDDTQQLITDSATLLSMYEELRTKYPNYISRNTLTSGEITNYEYVFTTGNYNSKQGQRNQDSEIQKPVILIMSGVHGDERCSIVGLYLFAKALCESPALYELKSKFVIKMLPIVCQSGYDANTRTNSNGVNINRNFDANWVQTPIDNNYSGAAPADQDETKIAQEWLDTNVNALIAIDWHNSAYANEISYFGTCISDGFAINAKKGYFDGIAHVEGYWENYRKITNASTIYGYAGTQAYSGQSNAYGKKIGIPFALLETSWSVGDYAKDSPRSIGVNAEAISAIIIGLCKALN